MNRRFALPMPDWSDRAAVAEFAAARAEILGDDPAAARATAERMFDRTPGTEPAVQMANQMGMVFSKLNCKPRWRERLPELAIPSLLVHGRRDRFFPVGNGEALAREIPGARLLVLEQAATAIPDAAADEVAAAMLALYAVVEHVSASDDGGGLFDPRCRRGQAKGSLTPTTARDEDTRVSVPVGSRPAGLPPWSLLLSGRLQLVRQTVETSPDHLPVPVVVQRTDRSVAAVQVLAGAVEITELAIALGEVQVQRRVERRHRTRHAGLRGALVGE
jgi:hypothetical protein